MVTYIAREAIDDFSQRRDLTDQERVALVTKNLDAIGNLIAAKDLTRNNRIKVVQRTQ